MTSTAPDASPAMQSTRSALHGIRVLDLSDLQASYCGKLLADMGADVIKVERPGGDPTRGATSPGGVGEAPGPLFQFYNTSKRGITANLDEARGRELLRRLLQDADVLIESEPPGRLDERGLGYADLSRDNPRLVMVSVTPFGQSGPRRHWRASDTVAQAAGGMVFVNGHPGEPPLRALGPQAYHSASTYAAFAAVLALLGREDTGRGQWIDVSIQECVVAAVEHVSSFYQQTGSVEERRGTLHWSRTFRLGRCRDGHLLHSILGDWTSLLEWVRADGVARDLVDPEWEEHEYRRTHCDHLFDVLDAWVADRSVEEVAEAAQLRRLPYAAAVPLERVPDDPQLRARGFFVDVDHGEAEGQVCYPGAPYRFSATPWRISRRPPRPGEHNREIYAEIGVDGEALEQLRRDGVV